jgi:hypothetical protein
LDNGEVLSGIFPDRKMEISGQGELGRVTYDDTGMLRSITFLQFAVFKNGKRYLIDRQSASSLWSEKRKTLPVWTIVDGNSVAGMGNFALRDCHMETPMFALFVRRNGLVVEEEYRKANISNTISAQRGAAKVRLSLDDVESLVITGKRIDNKLELVLQRKNRNQLKLALLLDGIDKDDMLLLQKPYGWEGISILPLRKISVMRGRLTETKLKAEKRIKPEPRVAPAKVKKPNSQAAGDPEGESRTAVRVAFNEIVYQAQKRLSDLAYDPGPIDGIWGPQTKAAIKKYQFKKST